MFAIHRPLIIFKVKPHLKGVFLENCREESGFDFKNCESLQTHYFTSGMHKIFPKPVWIPPSSNSLFRN
jgi:hypothetical protein